MPEPDEPRDAFAVERGLRAAVPEVLFAAPRIVRAIARRHREEPIGVVRPPHRDIVVLPARRLAEIAADLVAVPADLPDRVAVVARPDADGAGLAAAYWRLTFHALLDLAAAAAVAEHRGAILERLGPDARAEAEDVLVREGRIDRGADDAAILAEFTATFLELRCFAPAAVHGWFPALDDPDGLAEYLARCTSAEDLLARSLPPGHDPEADAPPAHGPEVRRRGRWHWWPRLRASAAVFRRRSDQAAPTGNAVRAAIDEWRAIAARPPSAKPATGRLERQVDAFAERVAWALDLDAAGRQDAADFIRALVERAAGSTWSPEARLLYDLQKVCVDSERESFRTQLLAWLVSFGRRPLAIPLPCQRLVLIHRHAKAAAARLPVLDLPERPRRIGTRLLAEAVVTTAASAREALRPRLARALAEAGLEPTFLVEEAAREQLLDELLDAVVDRGFISFGAVRDAISRNQLKLQDLDGVADWLAGDELLRLDGRLAATLDGVYRPAPLYLAAMQRLSAPFFGVAAGRLVTTHLLLPLGGAWIALRGLEHLIEPVTEYSLGEPWHVYTRTRMLATAAVIWALLHLPAFRLAAWQGMRGLAAVVRLLLVDLPARLLALPAVAWLVRSPPARWFVEYAWSPLVVTCVAWLLLPHHGGWIDRGTRWFPPVTFGVAAAALNSAAGRLLEEQVIEAAGRLVRQFHAHVIVGLLSWIVDAFRRALDVVEGTLYAVDESLRFRTDESGLMLAVKAVLGAVWSVVEAAVRFCVTLLIEPQLNPIKHFPVVTVSHKLLVPMIPVVASQLVAATGMERGLALTAVTFVSTAIPGVFGFLAWELKENWRLYAANRSTTLRPVPVGHHGESMRRLLLPGFHSGTVPKLFGRLRRESPGVRARAERLLHELSGDVAAFVDHDIVALVERTAAGEGLGLAVDDVQLASNRIRVAIRAAGRVGEPLVLDLVQRAGTIVSHVVQPGWLAAERGPPLDALRLALAGYHRLAAADAADAEWADMPGEGAPRAGAPGEAAGERRPLAPIRWDAWRDAWERMRSRG